MTRSTPALPRSCTHVALAAGAVLVGVACSAPPERQPYEIDCNPAGYELADPPFMDFEVADIGWWDAGDGTPRAVRQPAVVQPIEGGRCGSSQGLMLAASGYNDWGAAFGTYSLDQVPLDATGWEGLLIWARAAEGTTRAVTLQLMDRYGSDSGLLADPETGALQPTCVPPGAHPELRICYADEAGVVTCETVPAREEPSADASLICVTDAEGQQQCSETGQIGAHDCGNSYGRPFSVTTRWEPYFLPFNSFFQTADPNRRPEGIDRSAIHGITIAVPREAKLELLLDDFTLYRRVE